jgi:hypothetical protein
MEVFEIHITADEAIIEAAKELNVKTIIIDLIRPDQSLFRTEYMTSYIYRCENYDECKEYVDDITVKLTNLGVKIVRVKIECPLYQKYIGNSLYRICGQKAPTFVESLVAKRVSEANETVTKLL